MLCVMAKHAFETSTGQDIAPVAHYGYGVKVFFFFAAGQWLPPSIVPHNYGSSQSKVCFHDQFICTVKAFARFAFHEVGGFFRRRVFLCQPRADVVLFAEVV